MNKLYALLNKIGLFYSERFNSAKAEPDKSPYKAGYIK